MLSIEANQPVSLISYLAVRRAVGLLGMLLPVILVVGALLTRFPDPFQKSISDYYYTNMGTVFTGILFAVAIFLFTYKGYDNDKRIIWILNDNGATNTAALCAILVACFPDGVIYTSQPSSSTCLTTIVNTTHYVSAGILFSLLGAISFCFFSTGVQNPTENKRKRNMVYKVCGGVIWGSIALLISFELLERFKIKIPSIFTEIYTYNKLILEAICLLAFGISWLTKGETLWKD